MATGNNPGNLWQRMWDRSRRRWYLLWMPVGGIVMFFVGIIFWGGFNTVLEATNTESFCISCHEMRDNVYAEYKESIHYKNTAGVPASCPDCHVPRPWIYKMQRKIAATFNELPNKVLGTIDTREKFLAHREEMAKEVWANMKKTNSRECRNCHALEKMDLTKQSKSAINKHKAVLEGRIKKTCIECHQGIAHKLPEGY